MNRVLSLDVLRAFSMMVLVVSYVTGIFGNESTPSIGFIDLWFAVFLFCMGFSIPYSNKTTFRQKISRTVALFSIGVFLNGYPLFDLSTIRIMGILQRIALCYLICSVAMIRLNHSHKKIVLSALLVAYSVLLLADGGLVSQVDLFVLHGHTWTPTGDPEGLISTVGALCSAMIGQIIGQTSRYKGLSSRNMLLFGTSCLLISLFLGFVSPISIPIDKENFWSPSFVLYTSGIAVIALTFLHTLLDVDLNGLRRRIAVPVGKVLASFGANSILIYAVTVLALPWLRSGGMLYAVAWVISWTAILSVTKIRVRL